MISRKLGSRLRILGGGRAFAKENRRAWRGLRGREFQTGKPRARAQFRILYRRRPSANRGERRSDGVDVARIECSGDADAWLAVFREEGDCGAGVIEERGGLVGLRDAKHEFGLTVARLWWCGQVGSGK